MVAPRDRRWLRALVAFWTHVPGLWLCFRTKLGPITKRHNFIAIAATLASMLFAWVVSGGLASLTAWAIGHACWGAWLARRLWAGSEST